MQKWSGGSHTTFRGPEFASSLKPSVTSQLKLNYMYFCLNLTKVTVTLCVRIKRVGSVPLAGNTKLNLVRLDKTQVVHDKSSI